MARRCSGFELPDAALFHVAVALKSRHGPSHGRQTALRFVQRFSGAKD